MTLKSKNWAVVAALSASLLANCSASVKGEAPGTSPTPGVPTVTPKESVSATAYQGTFEGKATASMGGSSTPCTVKIQLHQDASSFEMHSAVFDCENGASIEVPAAAMTLAEPADSAILAYDLMLNGVSSGWLNKDNSAFDLTLAGPDGGTILMHAGAKGDALDLESFSIVMDHQQMFSVENASLARTSAQF
ncbi:MAG: hypothetical protein JST16_05965 [Bdellovibrionales bacterium]|nr:hypothetical protein [Bdellovibrionales bacterium]